MTTYLELKRKHEVEVNAFPMKFAFSDRQFAEAMQALGLEPTDTDKVYSIGVGGFIRKTDATAMEEMFERHEQERKAAIAADETGDGYVYEMFDYELGNHEYCVTWDPTSTLDALGYTIEEVKSDPKLKRSFIKATRAQEAAHDARYAR
jgi:hypothetical protein